MKEMKTTMFQSIGLHSEHLGLLLEIELGSLIVMPILECD